MEEKKIFTDHEVFEQIKDTSRKSYIKAWQDPKNFTYSHNFKESHPGEEFIAYFKHLRLEKKVATSYLRTYYSMQCQQCCEEEIPLQETGLPPESPWSTRGFLKTPSKRRASLMRRQVMYYNRHASFNE
jgi:hypothetical protein